MPEVTETNVTPFTLNLNGVNFEIRPHEVKKGKSQGTFKFRPDATKITIQDAIVAWGESRILKELQATLQARFNGISDEAVSEATSPDGFDAQKFMRKYEDLFIPLSARGESMKALVERRNELLEELAALTSTMATNPADATRFQEVAKEIAQLQNDIAEKKSKDVDETAPTAAAA